ncbi:ABC transporter permease [Spirochaetia bacterium]|nr:ABC transporter permease [Spirochaetia bacterium]
MTVFYFLVQQMMYFVIPLMVVALGGMFSERSGIVNIALDGTMIAGAFVATVFLNKTQGLWSGQSQLLAALLIAGLSGMIFILPHAFSAVTLGTSQMISGIALNLIAPAMSIFFARIIFDSMRIPFKNTFMLTKVPVLGDIPLIGRMFFQNAYITTYLGIIIMLVSWYVVFKTRFGLRLRSSGEYPQATAAVGINVKHLRYAGVLISGFLAGMGGIIFVVPTSNVFTGTVAGYGFLALSVLVFGQWRPHKIFYSALLFGLAKSISSAYSAIPFLVSLNLPSEVYKMMPYVFTIFMLILTSRNPQAPRAAGKAYISSE